MSNSPKNEGCAGSNQGGATLYQLQLWVTNCRRVWGGEAALDYLLRDRTALLLRSSARSAASRAALSRAVFSSRFFRSAWMMAMAASCVARVRASLTVLAGMLLASEQDPSCQDTDGGTRSAESEHIFHRSYSDRLAGFGGLQFAFHP